MMNPLKRTLSFKNTLILNFVLVGLLPLIVVTVVTHYVLTGHLEREITQKNFLLAKSLSGEIGAFLHEPKDMLRQLAAMLGQDALRNKELFQASLESVISNYPVFEMIEVLDPGGRVMAVAPFRRDYLGLDMSGRRFFKATEKNRDVYWSSAFLSQHTGEPALTISLPLQQGILVGILNLRVLAGFIDRLKQGGMEIGVLDQTGTYIASSTRSNVYQQVNIRTEGEVHRALQGIEGTYRPRRRGREMLVSVALVPETGWPVVVSEGIEEAFAPVYHVRSVFWGGMGLAAVLAFGMALVRVKKTLKPLNMLMLDAKKVTEGSYDIKPQRGNYPEFEELAEDFRVMARAIDARERSLWESEAKYRTILENMEEGYYEVDLAGTLRFFNEAFCRIADLPRGQLRGVNFTQFMNEANAKKVREEFNRVYKTGTPARHIELETIRVDDTIRYVEVSAYLIRDGEDRAVGFRGVIRDVSEREQGEAERKKLEFQLQQAQKMEALGTLAGGIAHDFNNLLMGIQGRTSLMAMDKEASHPDQEHLKGIEAYVKNAAALTQQLLGFARGGKYEVKPTDINALIRTNTAMFGRTKKEIAIHLKLQEGVWPVEVDRGQIDQVLMNLYINAWQAMPGGGALYIETENVILTEKDVSAFSIAPGKYVWVAVTDTGIGMDRGTLEKIFDPFFTTKETGRGSGLGLASAYGIIQNHGGMITVYSEQGEGTTFKICLPACESEVAHDQPEHAAVHPGSETILLVDDEPMILDIGEKLLERLGYRVVTAQSGEEALKIYAKNKDHIHLIILDMIMPGMSGGETFDRLKAVNPHVKTMLSSGYSINGQATEILNRGCGGFIQKPFSMEALSLKLREILDGV
ncbi:MAG: response regulator [Deltaproteobacteria bacterium]|nr:response regulator [Deltaproteobacteria bacterium]